MNQERKVLQARADRVYKEAWLKLWAIIVGAVALLCLITGVGQSVKTPEF